MSQKVAEFLAGNYQNALKYETKFVISKLIPVNIYPDTYGRWRSYYGSA